MKGIKERLEQDLLAAGSRLRQMDGAVALEQAPGPIGSADADGFAQRQEIVRAPRACGPVSLLFVGADSKAPSIVPPPGAFVKPPTLERAAAPPFASIPIRRSVHYMAWNRLFPLPLFGWLIRRLRAFPVE